MKRIKVYEISKMVGPATVGLLLLSSVCISCHKEENIIPEKKMIKLLADLEVARIWQRQPGADFNLNSDSITLAVLKANGITPQQLDSTMGWYGKNVDDYQNLYLKVEKELDSRMRNISKNQIEDNQNEDSKDLWTGARFGVISKSDWMPGVSFHIDMPDIQPGEILEWHFRPHSGNNLEVMIGAEYPDGESVYNVSSVFSRDNTSVKLYTDSTRMVRRIFGSIIPSTPTEESILIDSISLKILPMDESQYFRTLHQKKYKILPGKPPKKNSEMNLESSSDN